MTAAHGAPAALARTRRTLLSATLVLLVTAAAPPPTARAAGEPPAGTRLELGVEERVRTENWDNLTDFNSATLDARHQWRYRTRLWAKLNLGANDELAVGLNDESRSMSTPHMALTMDETVFETLYLDHRFSDGAAVRVGRQNLTRGDGFILFDGNPGDGSRTQYFNAMDLSWTAGKSRLDLLLIADPHRDEYLPRIHDRQKALIEWDEQAFGLYWTGPCPANPAGSRDLYYFLKSENHDTRPASNAQYQPARVLHTLGARVVRPFERGWTFSLEAAGQAGTQQPSADVFAWGGTVSVKKAFAHATKPSLLVGWTGLSGDDPGTKTREGWDPLFSRWPKWSDLLIYEQLVERGVAYWTNLSMLQAEGRLTPVKSLDLRATWYRLDALQRFPGKASVFAAGTHRGNLYQARADYKLNDNLRGHVLGEYLTPGDFYAHDDAAWFFRVEVIASFKRTFAV